MNTLFKIAEFIGNGFMRFPLILILYFILINIISESALLLSAFIGGSFGAAAGMKIFRHKTKHPKFYILVPALLIVHILIIITGIIGILK